MLTNLVDSTGDTHHIESPSCRTIECYATVVNNRKAIHSILRPSVLRIVRFQSPNFRINAVNIDHESFFSVFWMSSHAS